MKPMYIIKIMYTISYLLINGGQDIRMIVCKMWSKARMKHVRVFIHSGNSLDHEDNSKLMTTI
jgi:hypothetical protein